MKRVLVADDERSLRLLITATLEGEGIEILEACDGTEALAISQEQRPDLILLDVQMPGLSGFEVCTQLKHSAATATIPIIMLTAQSQASAHVLGWEAGADAYLTKPFSPLQLLKLIEGFLQQCEVGSG